MKSIIRILSLGIALFYCFCPANFARAEGSGQSESNPPVITTSSLPSGTVGQPYIADLSGTGGTGLTWWIVPASLPPGLSLNRGNGVISGTPTAAGTFGFSVVLVNADPISHVDAVLSITVNRNGSGSGGSTGTSGVPCTVGDTSGCPAYGCPGEAGSDTMYEIPGTSYGSLRGVQCLSQINYNPAAWPNVTSRGGSDEENTVSDAAIDAYYPEFGDLSHVQIVIGIHGGGFINGVRWQLHGNGAGASAGIINLVQEYAEKPNAVGGTGIAIITIDYPLAPNNQGNGGTYGNWPVQWQAVKCALWTVVANTSAFPGSRDVLGVYGDSAGGHLDWMMTNTPDNAFPANCPVAPPAKEPHFRTVSAWPILSIMTPRGDAEWNCTTAQIRTPNFSSLFGGSCSPNDGNACLAFSASHRPEPLQWITDENLATLQNVDQMLVFGEKDDLAMAYFDTEPTNCPNSTGGNLADAVADYNSLSTPIQPVVDLVPDCVHVCDVSDVTGGSVVDSYNFLTQ